MTLGRLRDLYERHIIGPGLQPHFVILVSFLVTFVAVRLIVHRLRSGKPVRFLHTIEVGGVHIHHLVPGILLLLGSGYALATLNVPRDPLAAVYGVGAALTLDEFAVWLQLKDVYWEREGRRSIDAVIIFAAIAAIGGVSARLLIAIGRELIGL